MLPSFLSNVVNLLDFSVLDVIYCLPTMEDQDLALLPPSPSLPSFLNWVDPNISFISLLLSYIILVRAVVSDHVNAIRKPIHS